MNFFPLWLLLFLIKKRPDREEATTAPPAPGLCQQEGLEGTATSSPAAPSTKAYSELGAMHEVFSTSIRWVAYWKSSRQGLDLQDTKGKIVISGRIK